MAEENNQEQQENIDQEELAKQWEEALSQQQSEGSQENTESSQGESQSSENSQQSSEENVDQEELAKQWEEALSQQQEGSQKSQEEMNQEDLAKQWEEALSQQEESTSSSKEGIDEELLKDLDIDKEKLELLLDIPLEISVEIGNKVIPLEDILKMTPNTIVELERYINEPIDIKVNGKLIAKGELYTVENNFGVKITSIITVQERMKLLMEEME